MNLILSFGYLVVAMVLFWQSSSTTDRDVWRRIRLYTLGVACMSFGAAQFMAGWGEAVADWRWMLAFGHASLLAFAVQWITREIGWLAKLKADGETKG